VADVANTFRKVIGRNEYDLVMVRGDRYEVLPIAMMAAYRGIKIAHIEGGDLSGAIDNKVRKAITSLADIHFATNKESYSRLIGMGTDPDKTFNYGSLDCEYAKNVYKPSVNNSGRYVVICYHPMPGEIPELAEKIVKEEFDGQIVVIKSNSDNGAMYGKEEYKPEQYIDLIAAAKCLIGNSSSFLKEASVFGTPVVNIGERQRNRLMPDNVISVPFEENRIRNAIRMQLESEKKPSDIYYKPNTSENITKQIIKFLE